MILYTDSPLEASGAPEPALETKRFSGGFLEGRTTPQGFIISRVISTDPAVFLKAEYAPGSAIPLLQDLTDPNDPPALF